jgi:hypothetical protein
MGLLDFQRMYGGQQQGAAPTTLPNGQPAYGYMPPRPTGQMPTNIGQSLGNASALLPGQLPNGKVFESGLKQAGFGQDGEDPSLYATIMNGGGLNGSMTTNPTKGSLYQWAEQGGPSLSGQLSPKLKHGSVFDPLGITGDYNAKATNAYDVWGTPADNAGKAGAYDWQKYFDDNGFQGALDDLPQDDPRGYRDMVESFDLNQNGKVDPVEFAQWHYQNAGQKEGRSISPSQQAQINSGQITPGTGTPQSPVMYAPPQIPAAVQQRLAGSGLLGRVRV